MYKDQIKLIEDAIERQIELSRENTRNIEKRFGKAHRQYYRNRARAIEKQIELLRQICEG